MFIAKLEEFDPVIFNISRFLHDVHNSVTKHRAHLLLNGLLLRFNIKVWIWYCADVIDLNYK